MFFLCVFLWLIFSMRLNAETAVAGLIISITVCLFAYRYMGYKPAADLKLLRNLPRGLRFALTLICETAKANAALFRIVFSRTIIVTPRIIYFRTKLGTDIARVALANFITLTPGTITVALNDGLFCVHCLTGEMAESIEDSAVVRQLMKFEE